MKRVSEVKRKTTESDIYISLNLDGDGQSTINTGIGFLNHMLELFSRHGLFNLVVKAIGDIEVDAHHTMEDVGIVLGQAILEALGKKVSIKRYGTSFVPMDESLAMVSLDLGGRPSLVFDAKFPLGKIGDMETELVEEFFKAIAVNCKMNIHIKILHGSNTHHMIEAIFKAFGRALCEASRLDDRIQGVMSTKGSL